MKHKGNISEIQLIRNKEIVRTFIELKKTCTFSYYKDICKEIAGMKAKQHYVSEDRAYVRSRGLGDVYKRQLIQISD